MSRALAWLTRGLPLWVILGALAAYFRPQAFAWTQTTLRELLGAASHGATEGVRSQLDLLAQPLFKWFFALTMFSVGTVIDPASFRFLRKRPLSLLLGLATQFTVMPVLAFLAAKTLAASDDVALGFLLVGCAPGAMTSNVLTFLARGDTAFSVTLTTCASILAVVLTPTLVALLAASGGVGISAEQFWIQLWTIAWTVAIPLVLGLALRVAVPRGRATYEAVSPAVAVVAIVAICCFVVQRHRDRLDQVTWQIFAGVVLLNALGFIIGDALARLYRFERAQRVTLSIEVGMQNAGMGVVLAASLETEGSLIAVPATLFTLWCIITAAALIEWLKRRPAAREKAAG